ncbi:hypothetical protein Tco_0319437 [Tanacetum coccineum]
MKWISLTLSLQPMVDRLKLERVSHGDSHLTKLDLEGLVGSLMAKPTKKHLEAIKCIFRYLKGSINMGLWYPEDNAKSLTAYAAADHRDGRIQEEVRQEVLQFLGDRFVRLDHLKMEMEMEIPSVKASANSDIIFFFTSAQDGNKLLDDERLSLADDLKKAHDQNQNKSK